MADTQLLKDLGATAGDRPFVTAAEKLKSVTALSSMGKSQTMGPDVPAARSQVRDTPLPEVPPSPSPASSPVQSPQAQDGAAPATSGTPSPRDWSRYSREYHPEAWPGVASYQRPMADIDMSSGFDAKELNALDMQPSRKFTGDPYFQHEAPPTNPFDIPVAGGVLRGLDAAARVGFDIPEGLAGIGLQKVAEILGGGRGREEAAVTRAVNDEVDKMNLPPLIDQAMRAFMYAAAASEAKRIAQREADIGGFDVGPVHLDALDLAEAVMPVSGVVGGAAKAPRVGKAIASQVGRTVNVIRGVAPKGSIQAVMDAAKAAGKTEAEATAEASAKFGDRAVTEFATTGKDIIEEAPQAFTQGAARIGEAPTAITQGAEKAGEQAQRYEQGLGKRVNVPTSTGIEQGTIVNVAANGDSVVALDNGRTISTARTTPMRDSFTVAKDEGELAKALEQSSKTKDIKPGPRTYLDPEDAARFSNRVPLSERDELVRKATGINPSRFEPEIAAEFAEAVKRDPKAFRGTRVAMKLPEMLQQSAFFMGMDTTSLSDALAARGFTRPGEISGLLHASNVRMTQLIDDAVRANAIGDATGYALAQTNIAQFAVKIGAANSEWGRAGVALQLQRDRALPDALRQRALVSRAAFKVKDAEKAVAGAEREMATATMRKQPDLMDRAQARFVRASKQLADEKILYQNEGQRLAAFGEKAKEAAYHQIYKSGADPNLLDAVMKLPPEKPEAIMAKLRQLNKGTTADRYLNAVMAGAYSGPLGHIRSAIGALANTVDELVLGELASVFRLPGFERAEIKSRLFGTMEAFRTYPDMFSSFWKDRISPEMFYAREGGLEGIYGSELTGWRRVFGFMLEDHGFYHASAFHFQTKMETFSLIAKRAAEEARRGGSFDDYYLKMINDLPADVVDQATKMAMDRRYIAKQNAFQENFARLVGGRFGPGQLKAAWLRPLFPAARFGLGFLGRQLELSPGGLVRAAGKQFEIRAMEKKAIQQEARMLAVHDLGPEASYRDLFNRAKELAAHPNQATKDAALQRIAPERDYLIREATKAGMRGFFGSAMLGWGLVQYGQGNLSREGFETNLKTPLGTMNVTWLMPYSAPLVFASIIASNLEKAQKDQLSVENEVVAVSHALGQQITDQDSLFTMFPLISDMIAGRWQKRDEQTLGQFVSRLAVPGYSVLAREADKALDNVARDPQSTTDYMAYYLPIARRFLRPKIDSYTGAPLPEAPAGLERLNPVMATGRQPSQDPNAVEDRRLQAALPDIHKTTMDRQRLSAIWGTGANAIRLTDQQQWESERLVAQYRHEQLGALMQSTAYKQADDTGKEKLWKQTEEHARRIARRDLALQYAQSDRPEDIMKFIHAAYDANGTGRSSTALWLAQLQHSGKLTPPIQTALDRVITTHEKSQHSTYTLRNYLAAAPYVEQYLRMRPFNEGSPEQWAQLRDQRAEYNAIKRQQGAEAAQEYFDTHPLLSTYASDDARNDARRELLLDHPEIKAFVANSTYEWVR